MPKVTSLILPMFFKQTVLLFLMICLPVFAQKNQTRQNFLISENAYRANNAGVGLLEQFKFDEAEKEFRRALTLKPDFSLAKINLAVALFNLKKLDEAKQTANEYLKIEKGSLQAFYILGLAARTENLADEALENFKKVLAIDPEDVGANVNAGQILAQKRDYAQAIKYFETAYQTEPFNLTAIYNLATSLQRSGARTRAAELLKKFQTLRDTSAGVNIGLNYLEQGKYAEAMTSTGAEKELIDVKNPPVKFVDVTNLMFEKSTTFSNFSADAATLFDLDGDEFLDLVVSRQGILRFFRNEKGRFIDTKSKTGYLPKDFGNTSDILIAADYDNDLKPDLLSVGRGGFTLYQNNGEWKFSVADQNGGLPEPTNNSPLMSKTAAFVDYDHDGDLDIFTAGGIGAKNNLSANRLFRNNNNGKFTDVSEQAKIAEKINGAAIVPTDFNNSRDIDLLVVGAGKTALYSNRRDDTFKDVAEETGINFGGDSAAAADVNKDGFTDFFIGRKTGENSLFLSDGKEKFIAKKISGGKFSVTGSQFFDYDNDGLIDLIASGAGGVKIWRNTGAAWTEVYKNSSLSKYEKFLSGDLDKDGDIDIVLFSKNAPLKILRNDGGNRNDSLTLNLTGRVSNKSGIGAKVLMRSGSLAQQLESYSASPSPAPPEIHFGLGKRKNADSIRVLWSSGIVQSETEFADLQTAKNLEFLKIQEVDRKPASCPYLYTWNGEKFVFITDFLGGGEMANWAGKGVYHYPDSDEFVRIAPDKLKAKNGFYEIRVTNELEEVMYLDHLKLVAVEHDRNTEIFPNEGLGRSENPSEKIYTSQNAHAPSSALNSGGENVTQKIENLDNIFYDDFKSQTIRGYAETHYLTINLDDKKSYRGRTILFLTGWTDYAFSSDNVSASQGGKTLSMPQLQVKNANGEWQTVIESIGISVGRPQTLAVDLTGKFLTDSREVRIVTNFKTFWDKIAVDTSEQIENLRTFELETETADLRERGYSAEEKFGGAMIVPDYDKVKVDDRWKNFAGKFTKTGDVKFLLEKIDDVFVIAKAGDEFVLKFKELPKLPANKVYTFLLYADGYSKEMDINSGSPDAVFPLPFKRMTKYPYDANEQFPMTDEKRKIYDETLTRFSRGGFNFGN